MNTERMEYSLVEVEFGGKTYPASRAWTKGRRKLPLCVTLPFGVAEVLSKEMGRHCRAEVVVIWKKTMGSPMVMDRYSGMRRLGRSGHTLRMGA
jgi:hypothetical protein